MLIKYVGSKPSRKDTVAGTELVWLHGETHSVSAEVGSKLLKHPDIWAAVDGEDGGIEAEAIEKKDDEYTELPKPLVHLENMSKEDLAHFALTKYGHKLDQRRTRDALIKEVEVLIERNSIVAKLSDA
jgi:hypothetical protein